MKKQKHRDPIEQHSKRQDTLWKTYYLHKFFPPQAPCRPFLFLIFPRPQGTRQPKNENQKT